MSGGATAIRSYFVADTHANRPATPAPAPNSFMFYYETDTASMFIWNSAWVQVF